MRVVLKRLCGPTSTSKVNDQLVNKGFFKLSIGIFVRLHCLYNHASFRLLFLCWTTSISDCIYHTKRWVLYPFIGFLLYNPSPCCKRALLILVECSQAVKAMLQYMGQRHTLATNTFYQNLPLLHQPDAPRTQNNSHNDIKFQKSHNHLTAGTLTKKAVNWRKHF